MRRDQVPGSPWLLFGPGYPEEFSASAGFNGFIPVAGQGGIPAVANSVTVPIGADVKITLFNR